MPEQGNFKKGVFIGPTVLEGKSMTIMVGTMKTGRDGNGIVAENLHAKITTTCQREAELTWNGVDF